MQCVGLKEKKDMYVCMYVCITYVYDMLCTERWRGTEERQGERGRQGKRENMM
jgi:hypothetical protein